MHFINISFILDIFKELITGYFHKGLIILDHEMIARRYFKKFFIYDILGTFPFLSSIFDISYDVTFAFDFFIFFKVLFVNL
jgi:hypothetical protein